MKKKSVGRAAFLTRRTIVALVICGAASSLLAGSLLAFLRGDAALKSPRTLTFAQRVAYQRAIEGVYWRHRIWPKENPIPKPALDDVMSQAQLEKKVIDYLRKSQALEDYGHRPLTADQLQAEMNRMAEHTKQPQVLRELFAALGNDPFVIAESLARPLLAERLLTPSASEQARPTSRTYERFAPATGNYTLPSISDLSGCTDDTWTATSTSNAPSARAGHTAVWTGTEMIVWGGTDNSNYFNTGGRYNASTDNWAATTTVNAPPALSAHTAVWTGTEMIVWAGPDTGGRYNPGTNSWTPTNATNAPSDRALHTAVWTGSEMIVWGGVDFTGFPLNTGGKYDPYTNSWTSTSSINAPDARTNHTAVWTGAEMIIWGGSDPASAPFTFFNSGRRYNPNADSWTVTSTSNAPTGRADHTAVWTGSEMIVWGGDSYDAAGHQHYFNSGGRYNPNTNSWTATGITANAPQARAFHTAVWTGNEMIIWGGAGNSGNFNTGGRYDPVMNTWMATSTANPPSARVAHTAAWIGTEMIVWGGWDDGSIFFNSGGRYCAPFVGSQLGNISTRAFVQTGDNVVIGGFIVQGNQTKRVIIRAIGPELGAPPYNVHNALANPTLELHDSTGALIASNNNWGATVIGGIITANQVQDIQNSGYAPSNELESAIIADLAPGNYTAIVRGVNNLTGVGLVEVYDLSGDASSILVNISTRSFVQTGDNVMIGGFIVQGTQPKKVIIRAIGPELGAPPFNVPNTLADPTLELHDSTGALIASNDNWMTTIIGGIITSNQVADIQNSGHAPTDSSESAIIATLPAGNYTAIVRGVNNTTGIALVEVYDLQ